MNSPQEMLSDVVDFQVAYLVWRCGAAQPAWVYDIWNRTAGSGEFLGAGYDPRPGAVGVAGRFMAMRERLIAIRVTLLLRSRERRPDAGAGGLMAASASADAKIENHTIALGTLDRGYAYWTVQQVFDPINFRLRQPVDSANAEFSWVRTAVEDQRKRTTFGWCSDRPVSL
jgi:hypothetical protein